MVFTPVAYQETQYLTVNGLKLKEVDNHQPEEHFFSKVVYIDNKISARSVKANVAFRRECLRAKWNKALHTAKCLQVCGTFNSLTCM